MRKNKEKKRKSIFLCLLNENLFWKVGQPKCISAPTHAWAQFIQDQLVNYQSTGLPLLQQVIKPRLNRRNDIGKNSMLPKKLF